MYKPVRTVKTCSDRKKISEMNDLIELRKRDLDQIQKSDLNLKWEFDHFNNEIRAVCPVPLSIVSLIQL